MKHMLAGASDRTLVLIDEFGSGTEPIDRRGDCRGDPRKPARKGCYGVITTHYANIKYYASNTEGIANGAMQFDVQNIRPLFRLEMGKPGSSFAIEIAPQDRAFRRRSSAGEREGRFGPYQYRAAAARDSARQALLGAEARPHPPDGPQGRGAGADLFRAAGRHPCRAAGDPAPGQAGGAAAHCRRQPADREYDPHDPRGAGREGASRAWRAASWRISASSRSEGRRCRA